MKLKRKDIIVKCRADTFMPLAAMFGICVIMHGDSSPGGGFQGGVLAAGAFLLFFLGYGGRKNYFNFRRATSPAWKQWLRSSTSQWPWSASAQAAISA